MGNKNMIDYIAKRLQERDTWLGIILLASGAGYKLTPELAESIVQIGMMFSGAILTLTKDPAKLADDVVILPKETFTIQIEKNSDK